MEVVLMDDDVPLIVLARALDQAEAVLSRVEPAALDAATPCQDWDVRRLVAHLVDAPSKFVQMGSGGQPDWSRDPEVPLDEVGARFRANADALLATWRERDPGADTSMADWQTAEFAVHSWDLARATRQPTELDTEVGERGLAFMSASLTPENRGQAFGQQVAVPDTAPVYDRLAAVAGRDPSNGA